VIQCLQSAFINHEVHEGHEGVQIMKRLMPFFQSGE
jgi:hypothetical protein